MGRNLMVMMIGGKDKWFGKQLNQKGEWNEKKRNRMLLLRKATDMWKGKINKLIYIQFSVSLSKATICGIYIHCIY